MSSFAQVSVVFESNLMEIWEKFFNYFNLFNATYYFKNGLVDQSRRYFESVISCRRCKINQIYCKYNNKPLMKKTQSLILNEYNIPTGNIVLTSLILTRKYQN